MAQVGRLRILQRGVSVQARSVVDPLLWSSLFSLSKWGLRKSRSFSTERCKKGLTRIKVFLTLCEATARSTKLRKMQSYKSVFYQKKEALLLISYFAFLTLSESFCLTDHEKQVQKFVSHWKVCQKSPQREVIRKNAYIAPKPQSVLLPALHLKFSRSLTNFQASQARQSSLRSKDRCPCKPRCRLDRSWNRALANRSLPAQQTRHQDKNCVQLHCRTRGWREAQLQRAKTTTFSSERRSFQSVNSIVCLSAAFTRKMATLR